MAITQSRMLALIQIAEDFKSQLLSTNRTALDIIRDLPPNSSSAELLSTIQALQHLHLSLTISPQALEILSTERAHFKLNSQRNTRQMLRARRKRGQDLDHAPNRNTAPHTLTSQGKDNYSAFFDKAPTSQIFTGAAAPYSKIKLLSEEELNSFTDMKLAQHKIDINNFYKSVNAAEPYADVYDDSIPLTSDHKRHLGLPVDDDEGPF